MICALYSVACDECMARTEPQGDAGEARWVARECGWLLEGSKVDVDLCPACRAKAGL